MKNFFLFAFLFCCAAFADEAAGDSAIVSFPDKISVQLIARYNYATFSGESTGDRVLSTNRPVDLGIGGGYGDWTWSSLFTLSFGADSDKPKTRALDLQLNHFGDRCFWNLFLKMNHGFYWKDSETDEFREAKLSTVSAGYDIDFLWNREHSLRSAYSLDRRQKKSNGSFIWGAGVYYHGIISQDSLVLQYIEYQQFIHLGPSLGYSYTWVCQNGWFFNLLGVASASFGKNITQDQWMLFSQVFPKFVAGYHSEKWSIHFPFYVNALQLSSDDGEFDDIFFNASGGFMVTRRF